MDRRSFILSLASFWSLGKKVLAFRPGPPQLEKQGAFSHFCFGSCNNQYKSQHLFDIIQKKSPQAWLWLGDNIYADTEDMALMANKYNHLKRNPHYQKLISQTPVMGVWDDHDYGADNAGKDYPFKKESQELFLDFIDEPQHSPRRNQEGIYTSYELGQEGKKVKFLLLDCRYHKDKPRGKKRDLLGQEQWHWLENELASSHAQIHVLVSPIGIIGHKLQVTEDWVDYPKSYQRLFELLDKYNPPGLIFLSGDKHFGAFTKKKVHQKTYFEIMSSGMTHPSHYTLKPLIWSLYGKRNCYIGKNFCQIKIHWNKEPIELVAEFIDGNGKTRLLRSFSLQDGLTWHES